MQQIITASGKAFEIDWAGVATIDGLLRFEIKNNSAAEVFNAFSDVNETKNLVHMFNSDTAHQWEGYTIFAGIIILYNDNIIVSLRNK